VGGPLRCHMLVVLWKGEDFPERRDHVVMSGRQREDTGGVTNNNNSCLNFPGVVNDEW